MKRTYDIDRSIEVPARIFFDAEARAGHNVALSYVLTLAGTLTADEVQGAVESLKAVNSRLRQQVQPLGERLTEWVPVETPGWVDLVELPPGAGLSAVLDQGSRWQEKMFDRAVQPWRVGYFAPLHDAQSAVLIQLHHAVGDGGAVLAQLISAFGIDTDRLAWVDVTGNQQVSATPVSPSPADADAAPPPASFGTSTQPAGPVNSRHQQLVILDSRPQDDWQAAARRYGVDMHTLYVAAVSRTLADYWKAVGESHDSIVVAMPTSSVRIREAVGGLFAIHAPNLTVPVELLDADGLGQLSGMLAESLQLSEQQMLDLLSTFAVSAPSAPAGPSAGDEGSFSPPPSDLQAMNYGEVPAMAVAGRAVTDLCGFAPATGTYAAFTLMSYGGVVKVCVNVDSATITNRGTFDAAFSNAIAAVLK